MASEVPQTFHSRHLSRTARPQAWVASFVALKAEVGMVNTCAGQRVGNRGVWLTVTELHLLPAKQRLLQPVARFELNPIQSQGRPGVHRLWISSLIHSKSLSKGNREKVTNTKILSTHFGASTSKVKQKQDFPQRPEPSAELPQELAAPVLVARYGHPGFYRNINLEASTCM